MKSAMFMSSEAGPNSDSIVCVTAVLAISEGQVDDEGRTQVERV